jgi:hypothetical protein
MTLEERSRLETLDTALLSNSVREHIRSVVVRVREQLARRKDALMSWEPFPLDVLATKLPPEIRSAWVFVLRAGADTGAERHPNSHQRMMSFEGSGDFQTGEPGKWDSNVLVSDPLRSVRAAVDLDPAECLASPVNRRRGGLGSCFFSYCAC